MASEGFDGFLFVNPGEKSSSSHKASSRARAFVMRKARADQAWSTRSSKLVDRRKNRELAGKQSSATVRATSVFHDHDDGVQEGYDGDTSEDPSHTTSPHSRGPQSQVVPSKQGQVSDYSTRRKTTSPVERELRVESSGLVLRSARPSIPVIGSSPDPFGAVAVVLDEGTGTLLSYCQSPPQ